MARIIGYEHGARLVKADAVTGAALGESNEQRCITFGCNRSYGIVLAVFNRIEHAVMITGRSFDAGSKFSRHSKLTGNIECLQL